SRHCDAHAAAGTVPERISGNKAGGYTRQPPRAHLLQRACGSVVDHFFRGKSMAAVRVRNTSALVSALPLAIALALAGTAAAQDAVPSDTGSEATRTLDRISVTGSRIKRTDVEAALPVTVIQKEEIEAQGISSAEQLLQFLNVASNGPDSLAANSGIAPPGTRGNNGVSGANLRGQ